MTQLSLEVDKFCCPLLLMLTLSCTPFPPSPCPLCLSLSLSLPAQSTLRSSLSLSAYYYCLWFCFYRNCCCRCLWGVAIYCSRYRCPHPTIHPSIHPPTKRPSDQATIHPTAYLLNLCTSLRRCRRFGKLHFDWPASSLAVNYISPTPKGGTCKESGSCACDCN